MATYEEAGVSIAAGDAMVSAIKPMIRSTFTPEVLSDIGLFGGMFSAAFPQYTHPVLVSSVDGVGTKLKVAVMANIHHTVGQDLVNHCVNDILVCGARPLFFLDYFATGKLQPETAAQVISGFAQACKENNCALIGGETAEMPGMYADGEYDMSGTIVGVVEKDMILNGSKVQEGDILLGLASSGLHTNGYSLARAVLFPKYHVNDTVEELGGTIADALLAVHRSYAPIILPILPDNLISGLSHITGGGIVGNTNRIVPEGLALDIDWNAWQLPPIFQLIQREGNISDEEMRHVFNLGIGLIIVCRPENKQAIAARINEPLIELGRIVRKD